MKRILGENIFKKILEVDYNDQIPNQNYIEKLYNEEIDGFVTKGVLNPEEVKNILQVINNVNDSDFLPTSNGKLFPYPYATISDLDKTLDGYIEKTEVLENLPIDFLKNRFFEFFNKYSGSFEASPPKVLKSNKSAAYGTARYFMPKMGGLFVHCGFFFQQEHAIYFDVVEEMDKNKQFSFFMMLQYPEQGGELTIYDMLWPEVNGKDDFENNKYVLDKNNNKVYLDTIETFQIKPAPGDILIFNGGPIWHRVEEIIGEMPRITFGGFINFSKDAKKLFYWG